MKDKNGNVRFVNFKKVEPPKHEYKEEDYFNIPTYPAWFVYGFVAASILFCLSMIMAIVELFQ